MIGQDLDSLEGGFNIEQILPSEVADLALYDVFLSQEEMRSFMTCKKNIPHTPIIFPDYNMTVLEVMGSTDLSMIPEEGLCAGTSGYQQIFPERVTFWESIAWCDMLKGKLVLPESEESNKEIYDRFYRFRDVCSDRWRTFYYFGTVRNLTTDQWFTLEDNNTPIKYDNFDLNWNNIVPYKCSGAGNQNFKYIWFAVPCQSAMCSACDFPVAPRLRLRGLCKDSLIDRTYFLHDYVNDRPLFDGEVKNRIIWTNTTWEIRSRQHTTLSARMEINNPKEYPLGRHTWIITGDKCSQVKVNVSGFTHYIMFKLYFK